jgi:hypothetical protein
MGRHDEHHRVIQAAPEGMIGGSACRCEGECIDGRYVPRQFEAIHAAVQRAYEKSRSDENETKPDRYPNQLPEGHRGGYFSKDRYDSGVVCDKHKVYGEEGGFYVDHPDACKIERDDGPLEWVDYDCPWTLAIEYGIRDCYAGDETLLSRIADEPMQVNWALRSGGNWTDCGWEYDSTFEWWLPGDDTMQDA